MPTTRSSRFRLPTPALLLLGIAIAGCGPSDPLEPIRRQQAVGDFAGSLEPLRELVVERGDDAEVNYLYGRALVFTGQGSLADWSLRKAMEDPDWIVPAGLQLAADALRTKNFPLALETANRVLEADPDNVEVLLLRANALAQSRTENESALADCERILELDPDNVEVFEPKILALLGLERVEEAAAAIEELGHRIEETESGSEIRGWHCAMQAVFAEESGELDLAAERWAACTEKYPSHPDVVWNSVQFYNGRQEFDRSREILRRALEEDPDAREFRVVLAEALRSAGRPEEAGAVLLEATKTDYAPAAAAAWIDLAKHHQAVGDFQAAVDAIEHAVEAWRSEGTSSPQLFLEYADALLLAGKLDRALEVAEGIELPAYRAMIRARVAQERGRPAEALELFDEAFRLWPDNPWARYYAALAAEAAGDFDRAIEAYRYSIRLSAGATDARVRLGHLLLAEGRPLEAVRLLRHLVPRVPLDVEGELLSLRLWAQLGQDELVEQRLRAVRAGAPALLGQVAVQAAEGTGARAGPAAGVELLRKLQAEGLHLTDPQQADALRALVRLSHEAGTLEPAAADVAAALERHPDAAVLHEIDGLRLELAGAPRKKTRAAYERAVALDPGDAPALSGLGRLALEDDPEAALALFDRAAEADPGAGHALRGAAQALVALGRPDEAEARLTALLAEHPTDAAAAQQLAALRLERDGASDGALGMARRAVRFRGGPGALELLGRIQEQRGDAAGAARADEAARALRERDGG